MEILLWLIAIIGHCALWCAVFNQVHATAWPRPYRKYSEHLVFSLLFLPLLILAVYFLRGRDFGFPAFDSHPGALSLYVWICLLCGLVGILVWAGRRAFNRPPAAVVEHRTETLDLGKQLAAPLLHGRFPVLLGRIPWNQVRLLALERYTLQPSRLPPGLDGLRICQISDLHFTGQLDRRYFEQVVEQANRFEPDLVFITGDIIDSPDCLDWIESVLGKLKSRHGEFYILGNHDRRIQDETMLRERFTRAGIQSVNGRWHQIELGTTRILLTGNELPWYSGAESLSPEPPGCEQESVFKILLSHSPDQLNWARAYGFDLMFAGHNHGGQIVLPLVGPVLAPSRYGTRYCRGTFQFGDMLMHVSRGISGDDQIRINSPPELGLFVLSSKTAGPD